jgi:23S rRNA pseudouridine2604 synthase
MSEKKLIRLQKFLSQQGVCSRRIAEELIFAGKVLIDGKTVTIGQKVDGTENITVDGKKIQELNEETVLLAWNKPIGVEVTFQSPQFISTEKLNSKGKYRNMNDFDFGIKKPITVGRLDKDSHGLLLITNDGNLANFLTHPKFNHKKEYIVKVNRDLVPLDLEKLSNGSISLGHQKALPCKVEQLKYREFKMILTEGRNRQIRKMCEACGLIVKDLFRVKFNDIELGDMQSGKFRGISVPKF